MSGGVTFNGYGEDLVNSGLVEPWTPPPVSNDVPTLPNPFGDASRFFRNLLDERASRASGMNLQGYTPFQGNAPTQSGAGTMFQNIFNQGMNGSTRSYDKAANRIRDRLATEAGAQSDAYTQQNMGRSQGSIRRGLQDIRQNQLSAYGDSLVGLEKEFEDSRLAGLGIASGAASGLANDSFNFNSLLNNYNESRNQYNTDNRKITNENTLDAERMNIDSLSAILDAMNNNWMIESGIFKFLFPGG